MVLLIDGVEFHPCCGEVPQVAHRDAALVMVTCGLCGFTTGWTGDLMLARRAWNRRTGATP